MFEQESQIAIGTSGGNRSGWRPKKWQVITATLALGAIGVAVERSHDYACRRVSSQAEQGDLVVRATCVDAMIVRWDPPLVFWARTPHLPGEGLMWDRDSEVFRSTSHDEAFDVRGSPVGGAVSRDLMMCLFEETGSKVIVYTCPDPSDAYAMDLKRREVAGLP